MRRHKQRKPRRSRSRPPWNDVLARSLRESLHRHRKLQRRFTRKPTVHGLHALRVETRRQLALVALAAAMGGRRAAKTRRLLKRCLHATATLRDADVLLVVVDKLLPEYPELSRFRRHLRRQQRRAAERAPRRLQRRARKLARRLRALAAEMDEPAQAGNPGAALARALREAAEEVRELGGVARRDETQLHRARIALKRLRYMVEALGDGRAGAERSWLEALRRAQHAMGAITDLDVLASWLDGYAARRPREGRRLRSARAAVVRRQGRLRRMLPASVPPLPVRLRRLLTRRRGIRTSNAGQ